MCGEVGGSEIVKRKAFGADQVFGADLEEVANVEDGEQDQRRKSFEVACLKKVRDIRPIVEERQSVDLIFIKRHCFERRGEVVFFLEAKGLCFGFAQGFS